MAEDLTRAEIVNIVNRESTPPVCAYALANLLAQLDAANHKMNSLYNPVYGSAWFGPDGEIFLFAQEQADAAAEQMRERCAVEAAKRAKFTRVALAAATASEIFANLVSVTQTKTANKIEELIRALPLHEEPKL